MLEQSGAEEDDVARFVVDLNAQTRQDESAPGELADAEHDDDSIRLVSDVLVRSRLQVLQDGHVEKALVGARRHDVRSPIFEGSNVEVLVFLEFVEKESTE